jgi:hypothetical protein
VIYLLSVMVRGNEGTAGWLANVIELRIVIRKARLNFLAVILEARCTDYGND